MYLPTPQLVSNSDIYIIGDVTIHPSAIVGPGTILQASANSRIVIQSGACIGMGVIMNAYKGAIEIGSGAILGTGVLIIGSSKIGNNACLGSATTIYNASVEATAIIPAGSLIGDTSRQIKQIAAEAELEESPLPTLEPEYTPVFTESETVVNDNSSAVPEPEVSPVTPPPPTNTPIIGKVYVNQLLVTLFPENQTLKRPNIPPPPKSIS